MSQRSRPISLPELSILSFDPTAEAADKKKGATGEAARPVGDAMINATTARSDAPRNSAVSTRIPGRVDGIDRAYSHAEEWLKQMIERGRREVFSGEYVITPQMAGLLLQKNPDNRHTKKTRIAEIRADLEGGRYVMNGEPIIVSREGLLNDGQHRLMACVESGVTFRSLVVFGVTRSSRLTLDQGTARTTADYLDMQGSTDRTKIIAAVGRMLWQYKALGTIATSGGKARKWPTKAEILGVVLENERDIKRSIDAVQSGSRLVGSFSMVAFCHLLLSRADGTMGGIFIERLINGANLKPQSPIFVLRERFINDPKMKQPERFEAVIRAWNAMRKGKELQKIQIMGSVPKIEG